MEALVKRDPGQRECKERGEKASKGKKEKERKKEKELRERERRKKENGVMDGEEEELCSPERKVTGRKL